ncbi:MAG TPA: ABC transporter ATP-binding protein [Gemmatimonadales bacterium]|nr:ABC transporter ATP-binding protein [Gemmatimonadales bacterium]
MPADTLVEYRRVSKHYGAHRAVNAVSFGIRRGEFFSLLGPSGCGKTTTLRLLAGLETPDADGGEILLDGRPIQALPPWERPLAMVFQSYALFPHLTVAQNVAFGLEQRKRPAAEIAERVARALALVRLDPGTYGRRLPGQLSGGQRQRVALARALVVEPVILLLDEPLGALDLQLRKEMQLELRQLNRDLGITFLYVTHDQEEALTLSDRIAVMDHAQVAQIGSPAEIYESPRTEFVARFVGEVNVLDGALVGRPGARIAVRPEWMDLFAPGAVPAGEVSLPGTVRQVVYLGETLHVHVAGPGGQDLTVALRNEGQTTNPIPWRAGDAVAVAWRPEDLQLLEEG